MEEPFQHRSDCADPDCLCQPCVGDDCRAGNRAIGRPDLSRRSGEVFLDDRPRLPMTGKPLSGPPLSCRRCAAFSLSPWRRWCLTAGFRTCFFPPDAGIRPGGCPKGYGGERQRVFNVWVPRVGTDYYFTPGQIESSGAYRKACNVFEHCELSYILTKINRISRMKK